jgi:aldehyde dehydrogenase (NAD+)
LAAAQAHAVVVGDPKNPATTMGPLVSERQWNHVQRLIASAIDEGAKLVSGGPGKPACLPNGYFVQPTVFSDVTLNMTAANEEIFGPVITIIAYDTVEEAIQIGNNTPYGLAAYVHGTDMSTVRHVAGSLRAGSIMINDPPLDLGAPFGGYKQSGNGREYAEYGFDDFTEIKSIVGYGDAHAGC